ncbi:uncharacterized protein LOC111261255 isoform X2 [Varroa jacobsoni]|uniref:PX domain-containing protein n=1 Tax=Varroa destructor TaxID=109461 RepID=A0A7M7K0Z7_VARDE|nr:uncharacterized protein LOC111249783 isoform X2 [Varroa destructor]XP_022690335.1 uncharacterized protein LOC111261255 isoform X2 [Varroa jacobsoni]
MKILIPSARTTEQGHSKFVVYTLLIVDNINQGNSNFGLSIPTPRLKLERRYRDFHALYKNIRRLHPSLEFADFPPKKIRHLNDKVTQERRVALQAWIQSAVDILLAKDKLLPTCVQEFLDLDKNNVAGCFTFRITDRRRIYRRRFARHQE